MGNSRAEIAESAEQGIGKEGTAERAPLWSRWQSGHDTMPERWAANEQEGSVWDPPANSYGGVDNEHIVAILEEPHPETLELEAPKESRGLSDILETPIGNQLRHQEGLVLRVRTVL